jgi:hypothetical protein
VTIRGYETTFTVPKLPAGMAGCVGPLLGPRFVAEVSTPAAVGTLMGFESNSTDVVKSASSGLMGEQEGSPTAVVIAYTGSSATSVKVQFANGLSDQMTPVQGWSVLVSSFPTVPTGINKPVGTVQALGSNGKVLRSMVVDLGGSPVPENSSSGPACGCPTPAGGVTSGQTGGGSAGSGVASGGSTATKVRAPAAANYLCPMVKAGSATVAPPATANG